MGMVVQLAFRRRFEAERDDHKIGVLGQHLTGDTGIGGNNRIGHVLPYLNRDGSQSDSAGI